MREPTRNSVMRYIASLMLLVLLLPGLLTACAGSQSPANPAGTATQDPPVPLLTEATHGIVDLTGTVPLSLIEQLRSRSDEVQAHGYQIGVVFFNDLASDPHQFATQVFNTNGVGSKEKNNGVLLVFYLKKPGTDGHIPLLMYITGGGISTALPDTLMDDYAQSTFVPARAQGQWQNGLLAFYDKIYTAELDPSIAQEWQSQHPQAPAATSPSNSIFQGVLIAILACLAIAFWLGISAVVASRRREKFFYTAFRLLGRFLFIMMLLSRNSGGGKGSRSGFRGGGGSGHWGGGGSSPSSGGSV